MFCTDTMDPVACIKAIICNSAIVTATPVGALVAPPSPAALAPPMLIERINSPSSCPMVVATRPVVMSRTVRCATGVNDGANKSWAAAGVRPWLVVLVPCCGVLAGGLLEAGALDCVPEEASGAVDCVPEVASDALDCVPEDGPASAALTVPVDSPLASGEVASVVDAPVDSVDSEVFEAGLALLVLDADLLVALALVSPVAASSSWRLLGCNCDGAERLPPTPPGFWRTLR